MRIHPTAIVSSEAKLADDVIIGPYAIIDGAVTLGAATEVQAHARVMGPLTMGKQNRVHSGAVIGDWPQDRKYKGEFSETIIGDDNIFREGVTVHRGTGLNTKTVIGHRCFLMANAHVGHNVRVGNDVMLVNGAVLGGHTLIGDRAIIGAYCQLHQFCRVGRLAMMSNTSTFNVDLPPFFLTMFINTVTQLNTVGLRRSGMSRESINGLRRMFQIAFREKHGRPLLRALADLPPEVARVSEVKEVVTFCNETKRGVGRFVPWSRQKNRMERDEAEEERE